MKIRYLSLIVAAALCAEAAAQNVGPGAVKLGKVQPAVVKTPEFNLTSGPTKRSKSLDWLEVEVEFESKPEDIDELTFTYTILLEKKLLVGQVTHINITKGRDHFSVMYVSPKTIEKVLGIGKALTGGNIENVWVTVDRQGQKLDVGSFKPGAIPNLPQMTGVVLNKDETPFAPLFYDRYEAIRKKN